VEVIIPLSEVMVEPFNMTEANGAVQSGPPDRMNYDPLVIIRWKGDLYLIDGHHRVARAIQGLTDSEAVALEVHAHVREIKTVKHWPWVGAGMKPDAWVSFEDWLDGEY
jgi:hypothetical protein